MAAEHVQDPGFGQKYSQKTQRMINDDGSYNVKRLGSSFSAKDFYSYLVTASGWQFSLFFIGSFLILNSIFAFFYTFLGEGALKGTETYNWENDYIHGFFFSIQTFTTVGYGGVAPHSIAANWIASANAFMGITWATLMAGLLFGRFSKPFPRIAFSKNVLITDLRDKPISTLQFRVVNERANVMMDTEAEVVVSFLEMNHQKQYKKEYYALKLESKEIRFFPLNWTIVHYIDEDSPLFGKKTSELEASNMEILVMIKGFDNTFHQTVYAIHSYKVNDMLWNQKFEPMFSPDEKGIIVLDLEKLNSLEGS
jgi:inward rectifier potassium channel